MTQSGTRAPVAVAVAIDRNTFIGAAASPGRARGRARRMDALTGGPDEVLVADALPARLVPLLPRVAAVVTGRGGALANTAILLRERGIPAVMGAADAVAALLPGSCIAVDGSAGTVTRVGA